VPQQSEIFLGSSWSPFPSWTAPVARVEPIRDQDVRSGDWIPLVIRHIFRGAVVVLVARDAERLLRFVVQAEELGGEDPFTPEVLDELGKLVPADWVTYCEQDRVRQRVRYGAGRPGDEWDDAAGSVSYWDIAAEHPICSRHDAGDFRALKLSDFMSLSELRKSRIYAVWFRPAVERELEVAIPSPPWHTKTFIFDRRAGRDFTERDRLVLDLLQPHFGRLWRAAQTRRRLKAAIAALESASEQDPRGLIVLAPDGRIDFASPPAHRLIREHFGVPPEGELPPALAQWVDAGSPTLTRRVAGCRLNVDRSGDALLLEEIRDELGLTTRERQVLAWVARGKTNPEIAEILCIAPTTVRRHLENIYAKLGVRTRTAAATRLLGLLDDEARQRSTPA
jgi:DNA-binding CsgD family transcriptional regulator